MALFSPLNSAGRFPPTAVAASGRYRVVIAKHDRYLADGIRLAVLQVYPSAEIVVCPTVAETWDALREEPAQLGIFGLNLPDGDGLDLVAGALEHALIGRCLVFTGRRDERVRRILKNLPMCDYFDTNTEKFTTLVPALQALAKGLSFSSRTRAEAGPQEAGTRIPLHQIFSARELEIFSVLGTGVDDHEAATGLSMSASTVKSHRARIMKKLGIQTRAELMRAAVFRGVVRFGANRVIRPGFERPSPQPFVSSRPLPAPRTAAQWAVM